MIRSKIWLTAVAAALAVAFLFAETSQLLAQGRGGGRGGGGGGGSARMGGGGGGGGSARMSGGGGGSMRMGGGGGSAMRMGGGGGGSAMRMGGGGGGSGIRLGSGGGGNSGMRLSGGDAPRSSAGSPARSGNLSPSIRMPSSNLSGLSRSAGPSIGSVRTGGNNGLSLGNLSGLSLPRQGSTAARPSPGNSPSTRIQNGPSSLGSRLSDLGVNRSSLPRLNGNGPSGNGLGNNNSSGLSRVLSGNAGGSARPNLAGGSRPGSNNFPGSNFPGSNSPGSNSTGSNLAAGNRRNSAGNSLSLPFAGRVSANDLGQFLNVSRRPVGADLGNLARGGANSNLASVRRGPGGVNLNTSQVNLVRNNVGAAFRNTNINTRINNINRVNNVNNVNINNNYLAANPNRAQYWNNWGGGIHNHCNFNRFNGCFTNNFWATNYCHFPFRRSYYWWGAQPWSYWYGCPTWSSFASFFPNYGWSSPYYYDYGVGGNVVYDAGYVLVNGQQVATTAEYAASAAELATQPVPADPNQAVEWLPLGTFTLSTGEADTDPSRVMQLAVDKDGNVNGTLLNKATNQTYPVQGRVDKETQRVAFTIGGSQDIVLETGLYNLTQQQTPVLVHGGGREETYLLYRLNADQAGTPVAPSTPAAPLVP